MLCKLKGADHCTSAKRRTSILKHVAEAFPPARQGTILNYHRVISIATNTSLVLNSALVTYITMTADVGLTDAIRLRSYPRTKTVCRNSGQWSQPRLTRVIV